MTSPGRAEEAEAFVKAFLEEYAPGGYQKIARYHAWRGNTGAAFDALEQALDVPHKVLTYILSEPNLMRLIDDRRWPAFLDTMGLREAWEAIPPEHGGPSTCAVGCSGEMYS